MSTKPKKFNHAYTLAFSVETDLEADAPANPVEIVRALLRRIADLDENGEWEEHLGAPFDSYENEEKDYSCGACSVAIGAHTRDEDCRLS